MCKIGAILCDHSTRTNNSRRSCGVEGVSNLDCSNAIIIIASLCCLVPILLLVFLVKLVVVVVVLKEEGEEYGDETGAASIIRGDRP